MFLKGVKKSISTLGTKLLLYAPKQCSFYPMKIHGKGVQNKIIVKILKNCNKKNKYNS